MKILWLGGIVLPRIAERENFPLVHANGWLIKLSETLGKQNDLELFYVFDSDRPLQGENEFYKYFGLKCDKSSYERFGQAYIQQAVALLMQVQPDIIHIWGTEGSHTLGMVEACETVGMLDRVVISIQGLVSKYAMHYCAYLPERAVHGFSIKDILKGDVVKQRKVFEIRGELEVEALKRVRHVIGRTDWDRASVWDANPHAQYHFNNETLREEFYEGCWSHDACEKYSIFCSQAHYPIKGVHLIIEALERIKREYPQVHLYIGGKDYLSIPRWKLGCYDKYLIELIDRLGLRENITFTGFLNAEQMKVRYLRSNVFVSASSIENSPNSVGEAMLLGLPVVSSRVGGVHNMLKHGEDGYLYPADEPYMLAYYVCKIFEDEKNAKTMAMQAREHAKKTHDEQTNIEELLNIYKGIIR